MNKSNKISKLVLVLILTVPFLLLSCGRIKRKTKETINKSGEAVGKAATEFVEGVGDGVEETLTLQVKLSGDLMEKGLELGKTKVTSESSMRNQISMYVIFNQAFSDTLLVKVFDEDGIEIGRAKQAVEGAKDDAKYIDVEFDERVTIEFQCTATVE